MKFIWCSAFPEIYAQLQEGLGSMCHKYMWILLCMILIWCSGFPEIYAQLEDGGGVSLPWVYVHSAIYKTFLV